MAIERTIRPLPGAATFDHDAWCQFIDARDDLRRPGPKMGINPFTKQPKQIKPTPDVAEIVVEGVVVGRASWSMSEEPLINIEVEETELPRVGEWARLLGGEVCLE
jgi:hypothetical protein